MEVRSLMLEGLKHALRVKFFWYYLLVITQMKDPQ
jgi:hypothetical protein